ncbi:hypothetical protein [Thiococcus pfennigii]|uniref:hypothetical protein n=1 Tax=Thiococcus pfennigii TaxID=1057 RepID=UPI0019059CF9|nr:hypothetical protein [Thiococcus pfennigii]
MSASASATELYWGGVGRLLIENGTLIQVVPDPHAEERALQLFVAGAGLGVLLSQRRLLVLHASAVSVHGSAVAFAGGKGAGKSTTTAVLCRGANELLADELLVIAFDPSQGPVVLPGLAQLRLWHDALLASGYDRRTAKQVRTGIDKYAVDAANIAPSPTPLRHVFLLDSGAKIGVERLSRPEAFLGLIGHIYVHRFGGEFLKRTGAAAPLQQLGSLLEFAEPRRLTRTNDLGVLPDLMALVHKTIQSPENLGSCPETPAQATAG